MREESFIFWGWAASRPQWKLRKQKIISIFLFLVSQSVQSQEGALAHRLMGAQGGASCPAREVFWELDSNDDVNALRFEPSAPQSPRNVSVILKTNGPVCEDTPVRIHVSGGTAISNTFYSTIPFPGTQDGLVSKTLFIPKGSSATSFSFQELYGSNYLGSAFQWLTVQGGVGNRQLIVPSGSHIVQRAGVWRDVEFAARFGFAKIYEFSLGGRRDSASSTPDHSSFICVLGQGGLSRCWGKDNYGQLGDGSSNADNFFPSSVVQSTANEPYFFKSIKAKAESVCGIDFNNRMYCWGRNDSGQLGLGNTTSWASPTRLNNYFVQTVDVGYEHSCGIMRTSNSASWELYCWGNNSKGQLGVNPSANLVTSPVVVSHPNGKSYSRVSVGGEFTCAIDEDQRLLCWGNQESAFFNWERGSFSLPSGESNFGSGRGTAGSGPQYIGGLDFKVKFVSAGFSHACVIDTSDRLWCWGDNSDGRVGTGTLSPTVSQPTQVGAPLTFKMVSAGYDHTCAISSNNKLYCWGNDFLEKLGNGASNSSSGSLVLIDSVEDYSVVQAGVNTTCALTLIGLLKCWGADYYNITLSQIVNAKSNITQSIPKPLPYVRRTMVSAGLHHACTLTDDWQINCWGHGGSGQLGTGSYFSSSSPRRLNSSGSQGGGYKQISLGEEHSCAIGLNEKIYCWGKNDKGQVLPSSLNTTFASPQEIDSNFYVVVAAGSDHNCAIRKNEKHVFCWGSQKDGRLGNGLSSGIGSGFVKTQNGSEVQLDVVSVGSHHSCGINFSTRKLYCWGKNDYGQLGIAGNDYSPKIWAVIVDQDNDYKAVALGDRHTCAIRDNNQVFCWGDNTSGQLGKGDFSSVETPQAVVWPSDLLVAGEKIEQLSLGKQHSCALSSHRRIFCWGSGYYGALGFGGTQSSGIPRLVDSQRKFIALAAGYYHTCAVDESLNTLCWGKNDQGQLGIGVFYRKEAPYSVDPGFNYSTVTSGFSSNCVLDSNNYAKCWGDNSYSQLGNGHQNSLGILGVLKKKLSWTKIVMAKNHACGISSSGGLYCWGLNNKGQLGISRNVGTYNPVTEPMPVDPLERYRDIAVGDEDGDQGYSCGVTVSGAVKCWGDNFQGRLGFGGSGSTSFGPPSVLYADGFTGIVAGQGHICALHNSGQVRCWGKNDRGQSGLGTNSSYMNTPGLLNLTEVDQLIAGGKSSCAIRGNGDIWCWGDNASGQLGFGSGAPSLFLNPIKLNLGSGVTVKKAALGLSHFCIIDQSEQLRCSGSNLSGQLGLGSGIAFRDTMQLVEPSLYSNVAAGDFHTCAVRKSGELMCWGDNFVGQLGIPIVDRPVVAADVILDTY